MGKSTGPTMIESTGMNETSLTPESQDLIGNQLRKVYADMVAEPLPDRFADLLNRLADTEKQS